MNELIIITLLLCPPTKWVNLSKEPWNDRDKYEYNIASNRCPQKYLKLPCVKKFIKVRPLMYRVICGKEKKK